MQNNIKYMVILSVLVISSAPVFSQQEPQYSQYMFNMMSVNPAYTGTKEALNLLMLSRTQWVGVEGAPRSHTFALHSPLQDGRTGVGASVIADNIGPVSYIYTNLNYAYRVNLNENISLSMGLKGGFFNYNVKLSKVLTNDTDNSFSQDFNKKFQPNFGLGAFLYTDEYYVGISIPKLIQNNLLNNGSPQEVASKLKRHYFIIAGYVYTLNSEWKIKPSVLNKMVEGAPPSFDFTLQALYNNKIWIGTTYRAGDALIFLFEIQANRQLTVGYSYDHTLSDMRNITNGSHEIMVSYDFAGFTNDKVKSPRYF